MMMDDASFASAWLLFCKRTNLASNLITSVWHQVVFPRDKVAARYILLQRCKRSRQISIVSALGLGTRKIFWQRAITFVPCHFFVEIYRLSFQPKPTPSSPDFISFVSLQSHFSGSYLIACLVTLSLSLEMVCHHCDVCRNRIHFKAKSNQT